MTIIPASTVMTEAAAKNADDDGFHVKSIRLLRYEQPCVNLPVPVRNHFIFPMFSWPHYVLVQSLRAPASEISASTNLIEFAKLF